LNTNTDDKNMTTQDLIKHLRQLMPLGPQIATLVNVAADRLEELQRQNDLTQHDQLLWKLEQEAHTECRRDLALMIAERDKTRAEVERLNQKLHEARIENSGQAAQLERTRPDPSRLEIAARLMAAHVYHLGMMYPEGLTLRQACFIEADALIAAAREGK
jgi:hypothetical protein